MNERIRELVKQAGGHFSTHTLTSYPAQHRESIQLWDQNIEKFAELLLKECIQVVDDTMTENQDMNIGLVMASAAIVSHFEIEE